MPNEQIQKTKNVIEKMINPQISSFTEVIENLEFINHHEPEMFNALSDAIRHISGTYQDKYESAKKLLDTKQQLYHPTRGKSINIYQMCRYLQRFMSDGHEKSGNKNDLKKIIHYALFDIVRMNRIQNTPKDIDIVDK